MNKENTKDLFDSNYVIKHLTVQEPKSKAHLENPGAEELLKKYKGENSGIPFWLIFDAEGNLLADSFDDNGDNLGCPASVKEVAGFIEKLNATSTLNDDELAIIKTVFTVK